MLRAAPADELIRPRLIERFRAAESERVLLVVAPGGYGKSIALRQYLQSVSDPVLRFHLRPEHGTLIGFARGLAEVFQRVSPGMGSTLVEAHGQCHSGGNAGAQLAAWAVEHAGAFSGIVAIDDLHLAQSDPQVIEFLDGLIRGCDNARWILCSRTTCGLPVGTWSIRGNMTLPVAERDLCFTIDEAHEVSSLLRDTAEDQDVPELLAITRGWPTALTFALRSSGYGAGVRELASATREVMYRYLSEQAYASLSDAERELLRHVAYLPRIDFDVLSAAGFSDARKTLEQLRARVTFISIEHPSRYYCHDLFREFLQNQVETDGRDAVASINVRLARALEQTGNIPDALRSYSAAQCEDAVLRIFTSDGLQLVDTGYSDAVDAAIAALPPQTQNESAIVLELRGIRESQRGRFDRAEELLQNSLTSAENSDATVSITIRLAVVGLNVGHDVRALLAPVEAKASDPSLRAEVAALLAIAFAAHAEAAEARRYIELSERHIATVPYDAPRAITYQRLAIAAAALDLPYDVVDRYAQAAIMHASQLGMHSVVSGAYICRANAALAYDENLELAARFTKKAEENDPGSRLCMRSTATLDAARAMFTGDEASAAAADRKLAAYETSDRLRVALGVPIRAFRLAWRGKIRDARDLLETVLSPECVHLQSDLAYNRSIHAILCAADGAAAKARRSIEDALACGASITRDLPYVRRQIRRSRLVCAIAEALLGRRVAAKQLICRTSKESNDVKTESLRIIALTLCAPAGQVELRQVYEGLESLDAASFGGLSKLLRVVFDRCGVFEQHAEEDPTLTAAELAVLSALARGESPKQIAQDTGRSVHTIRTLAQRAAEKLGCSGRQHTIAVARQRGLLSD